jgi:sulfur carrier protein
MKVNGTVVSLAKDLSLQDFLKANNYDIRLIAVERNGEIIPKSNYQDVMLRDQDRLEIVSFVGGG